MEFVKAMKIQRRMLEVTEENGCSANCDTCGFHKQQTGKDCTCEEFPVFYPELAEQILEKWNEDNPPKTYLQSFYDVFPDAPIEEITNLPMACVSELWKNVGCKEDVYVGFNDCSKCWNSPAE